MKKIGRCYMKNLILKKKRPLVFAFWGLAILACVVAAPRLWAISFLGMPLAQIQALMEASNLHLENAGASLQGTVTSDDEAGIIIYGFQFFPPEPIGKETSVSFSPPVSGSYAVKILDSTGVIIGTINVVPSGIRVEIEDSDQITCGSIHE